MITTVMSQIQSSTQERLDRFERQLVEIREEEQRKAEQAQQAANVQAANVQAASASLFSGLPGFGNLVAVPPAAGSNISAQKLSTLKFMMALNTISEI